MFLRLQRDDFDDSTKDENRSARDVVGRSPDYSRSEYSRTGYSESKRSGYSTDSYRSREYSTDSRSRGSTSRPKLPMLLALPSIPDYEEHEGQLVNAGEREGDLEQALEPHDFNPASYLDHLSGGVTPDPSMYTSSLSRLAAAESSSSSKRNNPDPSSKGSSSRRKSALEPSAHKNASQGRPPRRATIEPSEDGIGVPTGFVAGRDAASASVLKDDPSALSSIPGRRQRPKRRSTQADIFAMSFSSSEGDDPSEQQYNPSQQYADKSNVGGNHDDPDGELGRMRSVYVEDSESGEDPLGWDNYDDNGRVKSSKRVLGRDPTFHEEKEGRSVKSLRSVKSSRSKVLASTSASTSQGNLVRGKGGLPRRHGKQKLGVQMSSMSRSID